MPLEPKKPIDELLEASAKARRAAFGADPKMPNPMRTQLHHEISRLTQKDECESRWRAFADFMAAAHDRNGFSPDSR